jgi:hypothetical protein
MDTEGASSKPKHARDDERMLAVYAPPREAAPAPLPPLRGEWSAWAMFAAAIRDQRRVPWRALLLLGILPGLWELPADLLINDAPDDIDSTFDWRVQGREAGRWLIYSLWTAVLWGGQTLVSLEVVRQGSPPFRRLIQGIRFTPAIFAATATAMLSGQLLMLMAFGGGPDAEPPRVLAGIAIALLLLVPVVGVFVVATFLAFPLVERRRGLIDGLVRAWALLGGSLGPVVRLTLLSLVISAPLYAIGWATSEYVTKALLALLAPTVHLAWAHAYLRSSEALE